MTSTSRKPLHTFPDHAIGRLQALKPHLGELVQAVAPAVAGGLAFDQAQSLRSKLALPDWRQLEPDLLFEVPYRTPEEAAAMMVGVLLEHQSGPDASMPFRGLQTATAYWEPQVLAWRNNHKRGEPLRLNPVLLIVLHTGPEPWKTNRSLADLIRAPAAWAPYQPNLSLEFFDLPDRSPEALLSLPGEWLPALTLVRQEREDDEVFLQTFRHLLRRLEPLSVTDRGRWQELVWFLLSWELRRRPKKERARFLEVARESEENVALKEEVEKVGKLPEKTWEEEVMEEIEQRETRRDLQTRREMLRFLLERKFGPLPPAWLQQIDSADNVDRLNAAALQVLEIGKLDELKL